MHYLDELNPAQKEAIMHTEGPLMVIAGAGSGKTRVLTYRIAYLLENGVDPFHVLALTFTNKAAREMRERIEKLIGPEARNLWMGTFHSVFARILRAEAEKLGYPPNFSIYDTDDSKSLIRSIVKELGLDDKVYKPNAVLGRISMAKNRLISARQYNNDAILQADDQEAMRPKIGEIYQTYASRCFKAGAMDFDDLLYNTNLLFKDHPDALNKYQQKFHYVLVDEYQDTNFSQYLITKKLAAVRENICVVGDDAQSIYSFRGADIQNILNFEKDYPDMKVVKLEQNYRSTQNIVNAANTIIKNNNAQLPKTVWTRNKEGGLIELIKSGSDNEEGRLVANAIFEEKNQYHLRNRDFAILYRTNAQSRSFEEALRRLNINYKVVGGLSFYQRREIKDLLGYLRFTVNRNDEEALKRIINYPKRGIGDTTFSKLRVIADEHNLSLWEVMCAVKKFMSGRVANAIEQFVTMIKSFEVEMKAKNAYDVAAYIAKTSGIMHELYADKSVEGLSRYENLQELLNGIKEFVDNPEKTDHSLGAYLQDISLITDQDVKDDESDDQVTLMTIHGAKGLEFKNIFLVGMEEDLFPSQMMLNSREDLEEERRLFYVAVTRAQEKLTLSYSLTRYRFGRLKQCEPSRFLQEIDSKYLKTPKKAGFSDEPEGAEFFNKPGSWKPEAKKQAAANHTHQPSEDFKPSDINQLTEGMKVEHAKFGFGTVKALDTSGNSKKAKVDFENFGEKTLLLTFAKLMIVEEN